MPLPGPDAALAPWRSSASRRSCATWSAHSHELKRRTNAGCCRP